MGEMGAVTFYVFLLKSDKMFMKNPGWMLILCEARIKNAATLPELMRNLGQALLSSSFTVLLAIPWASIPAFFQRTSWGPCSTNVRG